MTENTYKSSKFNCIEEDNINGGLLIFNSLVGTKSLLKITDNKKNEFLDIIDKSEFKLNVFQDETISNQLIEKGIIVKCNEDEMMKLHYKYINRVSGYDSGNILRLLILTTGQCNFRCKYCYEDFKKPNMSMDTMECIYKFIKKKLPNYTGLQISWFGGEPLVAMQVIEELSSKLMKLCASVKKSYISSITTNGYLLDLENFKKLLHANVLTYQITIDGLADTHDKNRVLKNSQGTFEKIIDNIKNIKSNIKTGIFHVIMRINLTKKSLEQSDEYVEFLNTLIGNDPRFSILIKNVGDQGGENGIDTMKDDLLQENEEKVFFDTLIKSENSLQVSSHLALLDRDSICYGGLNNHFVIDSEGIVRKCTHFLNDTIDEKNYLGKIDLKGNCNLNNDKLSHWLAPMKLTPECNNCTFLGACFNRACAAAKIEDRENLRETMACPPEKTNLKEILIISNKNYTFPILY